MSARDPRHAYLNRRGPQRRTPMWVAATGFALVIGALAVMARTRAPAKLAMADAARGSSSPRCTSPKAPSRMETTG